MRCIAPPPNELTLAACRGDAVFGTLTVRIDRGSGLRADELYRDEIDLVRAEGGIVCEVGRLSMDRTHSSADALRRLFELAFRVARDGHGCTESFIEVHPRHARFYSGKLDYNVAGKPATCPRVNAPAVLMHLPLAQTGCVLRQTAIHHSCSIDHALRPKAHLVAKTYATNHRWQAPSA